MCKLIVVKCPCAQLSYQTYTVRASRARTAQLPTVHIRYRHCPSATNSIYAVGGGERASAAEDLEEVEEEPIALDGVIATRTRALSLSLSHF